MAYPLEFADVDNDGDLDAVYMASGTSAVQLNDGTGNFSELGNYYLSGGMYIAACFALMDMDDDGDADHVWGHGNMDGGGTDSLFWNPNDGTGAVGTAQFAGFAPTKVFSFGLVQIGRAHV